MVFGRGSRGNIKGVVDGLVAAVRLWWEWLRTTHEGYEPSPRVNKNRIALAYRVPAHPSMVDLDPKISSGLMSNILNHSPRRRSPPSSGCPGSSSSSLATPRHAWHCVARQIRWHGAWQHLVFDFGGALPLRAAHLDPAAQLRTCVAAACDTSAHSFVCAAGDVACDVSAGNLFRGAKCGLLYSTQHSPMLAPQ